MAQTAEQVYGELKQKRYAPLYFLQGDEPYYIDLLAGYIEKHAIAESEKGFNQIIVYGKEADMSTIAGHARRYPMMAERQVVIVKEAQELPDLNTTGQQLLEAYARNPTPSTILVFCHKYKTLDARKSLGRTLQKFAVLVECKKLYDNQVPDWISNYVRKRGFAIQEMAVQLLADYIGNNLQRLSNEIEKILINFKKGETNQAIDANTVQKYVGISKEYNVFELQKALAAKDVVKANRIVHYFEANLKANPIIPTIALLFTFFSKLLLVHHTTDKTERGLATLLKINPFFVKEYRTAAVHYPLPKVIQNIQALRLADQHAKGIDNTGGSDAQILKELVFRLLH